MGRAPARVDDLGARLLRGEHRPSAERDLWTNHLAHAALARRRANAGRVSANAEAVEFHEPLQRRAPASGRVIGDGLFEAHDRFERALWGSHACSSRSRSPMDVLHADGLMAKRILPLTQALLIVSAVVVVIITALVLIAVFRRGRGGAVADTPLLESPGGGWISIGVGLSTIVLVGLAVWTSIMMAEIANPPGKRR